MLDRDEAQVKHWLQSGRPALRIDPLALAARRRRWPTRRSPGRASAWRDEAVLIYATAAATKCGGAGALGAARAGQLVERCLARSPPACVDAGVRRLVVAGGETSGAVVQALGVRTLRIGAAIDPGVPWTQVVGRPLLLALKSGNFGSVDFFAKALAQVS